LIAIASSELIQLKRSRQGEIILRTRTRRLIFIAGLTGLVVLALVMEFAVLR